MNELEDPILEELNKLDPIIGLELLDSVKSFISKMEVKNRTNEQWFLDWEIEINKLSVKDHDLS